MKQVIVIRKDLNMRKGKMIAQGAHASLNAVLGALDTPNVKEWLAGDHKKICVSCASEADLEGLALSAFISCLPRYLVTDLGLTEFDGVETKTALAIGPAPDELIDPITGHLPLL